MKHEGALNARLTIVFITRQKIAALNKKFLNRSYATDVLAFNLKDNFDDMQTVFVGDVFISTDAVINNAKEFQSSVTEELALYISHGILHLLGFDDHNQRQRERMRAKEREHLNFLKRIISKLTSR